MGHRLRETSRAAQPDVLLIAADWRSRALILAELQERGLEVTALPGLRLGLKALIRGRLAPRALLIDVWDDDFASPQTVGDALALLPQAPVVLVVGTWDRARYEDLAGGQVTLLVRPVSVGEIVSAMCERLKEVNGSPSTEEDKR